MSTPRGAVRIVGAGPTGLLTAILLRQRDIPVTVYERRADPRRGPSAAGRSINLALAARGMHALDAAGILQDVRPLLIPMRGRMVHIDGGEHFQAYGQRPDECIYSISRHALSAALLTVAESRFAVQVQFDHRVESPLDAGANGVWIAADGAGSDSRKGLQAEGHTAVREQMLTHAYKELQIPAAAGGGHALQREALHIWPRREFMMIALPNLDGTFTATLFLALDGSPSFDSLRDRGALESFFTEQFPDAARLMPDYCDEFFRNPTGILGTVYAEPWHRGGSVLLMGDAAHAIVPFHGQGMNCCFEDCSELAERLDASADWEQLFRDFEAARKPNTDAIAAMALENYLEMRAAVASPQYLLQRRLELELERRHPDRFIPRYAMVMFHPHIAYAEAQRRGSVQMQILRELTRDCEDLGAVNFEQAAREIAERLPPVTSAGCDRA